MRIILIKKAAVLALLCGIMTILIAWFWPSTYHHASSNELASFPFVLQPDNITCGPTSTLMVLKFYEKDTTLDQVKQHTKTKWFSYKGQEFGTTIPDCIPITLDFFGAPASMWQGELRQLKYYVDHGRPPIVLVRTGKYLWHYVVVIGYTETTVIVADPGYGERAEWLADTFMGAWNFLGDTKGNRISYLCPLCKGSGHFVTEKTGPLTHCDVCGGNGYISDIVVSLLRAADIYPRTMIVPRYPSPNFSRPE